MMKLKSPLNKKDKSAVEDFCQQLVRLMGKDILQVSLFGSKATGEDTPESDIDVFVLVKDSALKKKKEIYDLAFAINLKHDVYVSPRILSLSIFNNPVWSQTPFLRAIRENAVSL